MPPPRAAPVLGPGEDVDETVGGHNQKPTHAGLGRRDVRYFSDVREIWGCEVPRSQTLEIVVRVNRGLRERGDALGVHGREFE